MDRVDRLIRKVKPPTEPWKNLVLDNPYMKKNSLELLDMLCPETPGGYQAPVMHTTEWVKFIYALIHTECVGGLEE